MLADLGIVAWANLQVTPVMAESLKDNVRQQVTEDHWPTLFNIIDKHTIDDTKGEA